MRILATVSFLYLGLLCWGQTKPTLSSSSPITNAGGGSAKYAPGSIIYIRGNNLATEAGTAEPPYPQTLKGTSVSVTQNGVTTNAALMEALPDRLTVQLPYGVAPGSSTVTVTTAGGSVSRGLSFAETAPRPVYRAVGADSVVEAYHADGRAVTDLAPARAGEEIRLIVQGLGETTPAIAAGALPGDGSDENPYHQVNAAVTARLIDLPAEVRGARLAPGRPGFYEVVIVTPAEVLAGLYAVSVGIGEEEPVTGGSLPAGGRIVDLTKVWNSDACETVEQAEIRFADDVILTQMETKFRFDEGRTSFTFQLLDADGEVVLDSGMAKQDCDAENPDVCVALRRNLRVPLPAGRYTMVPSKPGLCVNAGTEGQAFLRARGAWAESNWQVTTDGWLTADGGTFDGPGLTLTAEPGAIAGAANLKLSTLVRPQEPQGDRVTPYFRLEGLPAEPAGALTLTLAAAGTADGPVTLLMQPEGIDGGPTLFDGTAADGKITVELTAPAAQKAVERTAKGRTSALKSNSKISWLLWAMAGLKPNSSRNDHFVIHAPSSAYELTKKLGDDLEDSYDLIAAMGLDWGKRGTSAIEVYLFSYSSWSSIILGGTSGAAGNSETGIWGKQNTGLCLNLDPLQSGSAKDQEDARITAGHELLHIMQAQYEGASSSGWLWLEEAAATWLERALSSDAAFVSGNAQENMYFLYTDPLEVASWWSTEGARRHGYGASLLLQSLAPASPGQVDARIGDLMKLMASEEKVMPVEGLEKVFGPMHENWWNFCDRYLGGQIVDGFPSYGLLTGGTVKPVAWTVSKNTSSFKEMAAYPHLGARLYMITFDKTNPPSWPDQAKLRLTLTSQGLAKAFVYTMRGSSIEKAGEFMEMFDLEDLQKLAEDNGRVFVMVSNGTHLYPNNGTTDVQLQAKLDGEFTGVNEYAHSFHAVLYNSYYELDFDVTVTSAAPFQITSATEAFQCCLLVQLTTPPIDLKTKEPGEDQVDQFTVTVTYKGLKAGPKAPGGWKDGMRVKAGFDLFGSLVFDASTQSKTYAVTRGGASVSSTFMTDVYWPDGGSMQGGADTPVVISFYPLR